MLSFGPGKHKLPKTLKVLPDAAPTQAPLIKDLVSTNDASLNW
jgi:hypothetical protein